MVHAQNVVQSRSDEQTHALKFVTNYICRRFRTVHMC